MPDQGTSNIFNATDKVASPESNTTAGTADPNSPVAILVGEGRKYKTVEDLAKAYLAGDEFIETLKGENAKLRDNLAKAKTLDEVLERLKQPNGTTPDQGDRKSAPAGLSAQDVQQVVSEMLTGRETELAKATNLKKADAEMKKLFGEKAKEVFDKEAPTPELRQSLIALAAVSPEKFLALFVPKQGTGSQVDGTTSVNTSALNEVAATGRAADSGCKEYFDALRKANPKSYYSQATQLQIHQAAQANPDKYFGKKSS